jgi:hypothetical protein
MDQLSARIVSIIVFSQPNPQYNRKQSIVVSPQLRFPLVMLKITAVK